MAISSSGICNLHEKFVASSSAINPKFGIRSFKRISNVDSQEQKKTPVNHRLHLSESLSKLLHLPNPLQINPQRREHCFNFQNRNSQITSPKEEISSKWREIQGCTNWDSLLNPLHPWLRREIVKYGEFAQATYDGFDFNSFSKYCGSCRYNSNKLFEELELTRNGYKVTNYIYAMSHIELPSWMERSIHGNPWSHDSNWMGFVAVSDDDETLRIGRRDIVVSWRGTVSPSEWFEDLQRKLEPVDDGEIKVEHGFLSIYTSKSEATRYNKSSASEQVMKELEGLISFYKQKGEEVSITITGHSLGGALALLNAYEAASTFLGIPISVISFGAPRVGNSAFRDTIHKLGVKTLRVVNEQDLVPKMPGVVFNETLQKFEKMTGSLEWCYSHVGVELRLNTRSSPYLKHRLDLIGFHSLETYLHLVDGFLSNGSGFRTEAKRDYAFVNKSCGMLLDDLGVPECWYEVKNKDVVLKSL